LKSSVSGAFQIIVFIFLTASLFSAVHMSAFGTSRHFAATQQFGRFPNEADIQRVALTELEL